MKPMCNKMTLSTYPHSFRKIFIIPMMITKQSITIFTKFTFLINRIFTFIFYTTEISTWISNTVFSHVISSAFSIIFSIIYPILSICFKMTRFTKTIKSSRCMRIFNIFRPWEDSFAFIALLGVSYNPPFTYPITTPRTSESFMSMGGRNFKFFSTYNTVLCNHTLSLPYILLNVKGSIKDIEQGVAKKLRYWEEG